MSGLPRRWVEERLSEVCELITDGTHHSPSNGAVGEFKYVTAKNIRKQGLDLTNITYVDAATHREIYKRCPVKLGDVLYIKDGATTGLAIVNPLEEQFSMLSSVALLRPSGTLLNAHFLRHQLNSRSLRERMTGDMTGSAIRRLTLTTIGRQEVAVPPLAEQKRIVAKLDALNAKSARARTELARIETLVSRYKQAVLSKAFSGELARKDLGDLVARIKAGKNLRCDERPPHPLEKGVVKVSAVTWGEFRADQSKTLPPHFEPDENTRIRSGDFLFSRANTIELVGAVVIVAEAPDNLYLSDKILRLEFNEPVDAWLLWYLRSPMGREALMNISSGNQLSMRNIGQKSLLSLSIPYADAELRTEIVRRIESAFARIDRLAKEAKRALELVGRLDEAILAKAFRGELVPQDENDEPAKHLLARIRAERAAAPKARRGRAAKA